MIGFGICVGGDGSVYRDVAEPTVVAVADAEDQVWTTQGASGICVAYNEFLERATGTDDCEALVLMHDDVEIHDPRFRATVLDAVAEPDVGVVGVVGGAGLWDATWWESRRWGGEALYTPEVVGSVENRRVDVDVVDGFLMVLSRRAVRSLRFDADTCPGWHGYDTDICLQARRAGLRVVVRPLDTYHRTKATLGDEKDFRATKRRLVAKHSDLIRRRRPDEWAVDAGARVRRKLHSSSVPVRRGPGAPSSPPVAPLGAQLATWVQELLSAGTVLVLADTDTNTNTDEVAPHLAAAGFDVRTAHTVDLVLVRTGDRDALGRALARAADALLPGRTLLVEWAGEDPGGEVVSAIEAAGFGVARQSVMSSDVYRSLDVRRDRKRRARQDRTPWPSRDLVRVVGRRAEP